jgi:hypothetical protein
MTYNPFRDAKFLTAAVDVVVSLVLYFVGKYAGETILQDTKTIILALQPITLMLIAGFFQRDSVMIRLVLNQSGPGLVESPHKLPKHLSKK